jgi:hypothetical protein
VILVLNIHYSRASDLIRPDHLIINPSVPVSSYRDGYTRRIGRVLLARGRDAADVAISTAFGETSW